MRILLPPSETKRLGGRLPFITEALLNPTGLSQTRSAVRDALVSASLDEDVATKALKLGVKNRDERLRNLELDDSGAMPAIDRYTGVLFDALDAQSLEGDARNWLEVTVLVQSALFGLLRANDPIPSYRLSASSRLPLITGALAKQWAPVHDGALAGAEYVLDLRSKDYAALAPLHALGAHATDYLEVVARSDAGEIRALNHFNKAAKGELVRALAVDSPSISSRSDLIDWATGAGIEISADADTNALRLLTVQGQPLVSR